MSDFDKGLKEKIEKTLKNYPTRESAILPCLHHVQNKFGWVKSEHIEELSKELNVNSQYIYATATFYTMYNMKPVGKYHLQICKNISCSLLGAKGLVDHLKDKLKIDVGETTKDGKFTISTVECLGACGNAPVMMVNDKYHEDLTVEKVDKILDECK